MAAGGNKKLIVQLLVLPEVSRVFWRSIVFWNNFVSKLYRIRPNSELPEVSSKVIRRRTLFKLYTYVIIRKNWIHVWLSTLKTRKLF